MSPNVRVGASLAATTGVESAVELIKYLLAGADAVMTASALLRHGPEHAAVLLDGLCEWMRRKGYIPPSKNCAGCSPHPSAAVPTLVDLSKDAELVVTGCRGSGR
jgi:hypothetical protein